MHTQVSGSIQDSPCLLLNRIAAGPSSAVAAVAAAAAAGRAASAVVVAAATTEAVAIRAAAAAAAAHGVLRDGLAAAGCASSPWGLLAVVCLHIRHYC